MRRPGGTKVYETFSHAAAGDVYIRPSRKREKPSGHRLSVRLNEAEHAYLLTQAGVQTLSNYVRDVLLGEFASNSRSRPLKRKRSPKTDTKAVAKALALLGQSRLAANVNQIAKLAHMGALPVTDDLTEELHSACADIAAMRAALMKALHGASK
ncbi:MAG: hypothetical protein HRT80_04495 [Henriciella sp.]|nr:hypothetical protein [Henriciella sp.]